MTRKLINQEEFVPIPFLLPGKLSTYGLIFNVDNEELVRKLETIPGIAINPRESRAEGRVDAIAAACFRLGVPPPKRKEEKVDLSKLPTKELGLKEYQVNGITFCKSVAKNSYGAILADDMGLGKTRQSIGFALANGGRNFIIGPAYVRDTWANELIKLGITDLVVLEPGTTKKNKLAWDTAHGKRWVITSYALADRAFDAAFAEGPPRNLLIDEFHNLRGREAKRTKEISNIAAQVDYKIGLTGTPQWSRPRDWWALLSILFGNAFGSRYSFDSAYCGGRKNEHGGWDNSGATNTDELKLRLSYYMIRRTKTEVARELPKLTRQVIWMDADDSATVAFHHALAHKTSKATATALQATLNGKIEAALNLASEAKQFLLFTYMKSHAHQIAKILSEEMDTPCVLLTGDIDPSERQALVRQAVTRKMGVVATIDSAGTGIDGLQNSISVGIMHALDYVPIKMAQAEGRLDRIGQVAPVMWYYLAMKDSMDAVVVKSIVGKMDQNRAILGQNEGKQLRDALSDSANLEGADENYLRDLYASL